MIKKTIRYFHWNLVLVMSLLFGACSEDPELIGGGNSSPVVYCLLNPQSNDQYLRLSRSFVIEGNPSEMEISPDSLVIREDFYAYLEYVDSLGNREVNYFYPTTFTSRDSGYFPSEGLVVLRAECRVISGREYGLYVYFPSLSRIVAGTVSVIYPVRILDPNPFPGREITLLEDQGYNLRWTKSAKFAVYQPVVRLNFMEGDKDFQILRQIELPQDLVFGDTDNEIITEFINGGNFISDLAEFLPIPGSGIRRKIIGFDLLLWVGGTEMSVMIRSGENQVLSFTGLNEFSNLDGAVGLYSSYGFTGVYNNRFSDITINMLADHEKTKGLGFLHYQEDF